jgi:hypothetical protein
MALCSRWLERSRADWTGPCVGFASRLKSPVTEQQVHNQNDQEDAADADAAAVPVAGIAKAAASEQQNDQDNQ